MAASSILILVLVVITTQSGVHQSMALESVRDPSTHLEGGPSQESQRDDTASQVDSERQLLRSLLPGLAQLAQVRAIDMAMNRDDDHSNIELDKLNEAYRYETIAPASVGSTSGLHDGDSSNLARLFSKMVGINRANDYVKNQIERKRNSRQIANNKEDKDYTFVGAPISRYTSQQHQQRAPTKWSSQKLRDILQANRPVFR